MDSQDVAPVPSLQVLGTWGPWFLGSHSSALEFDATGERLWAVDGHGAVVTLDVPSGRELQRWKAHDGGANLALVDDGRVVTIGTPKTVRIWNGSGTLQHEVVLDATPADVALAGRRALVVCYPRNSDEGPSLHGIDVDQGRVVFARQLDGTMGSGLVARPVSRACVLIGWGGGASLFDADGTCLQRFRAGPGTHMFDAAVDPESGLLAAPAQLEPDSPHRVVVWKDLDVDSGPLIVFPEPGAIAPFSTLPLGEDRLLVLGDRATQVWSLTGSVLATVDATAARPMHAIMDPSGRLAAWEEGGGQVRVLDLATLRPFPLRKEAQIGHRDWIECLAISGDGEELASGGRDGVVCRWSTRNGKLIAEQSVGERFLGPVAIRYDLHGDMLIGGRHEVHRWPLGTTPRQLRSGNAQSTTALALSPNGACMALAAEMHMRGRSWYGVQLCRNDEAMSVLAEAELDHSVRSLHFTADASELVVVADARLEVLRVSDLSRSRSLPLVGSELVVAALHPSSPCAAIGDEQGIVRIVGLADGRELSRFVAYEHGPVTAVGWAQDLVVTAGGDPTTSLALWRSGNLLQRFEAGDHGSFTMLVVSLDGRFAALGGSGDTRVRLWNLDRWLVR